MSKDELTFPDEFTWGCATAAYQIEGAAREDGRGPSIWDTFSHAPGNVAGGDTGDVADDHYHRYREDVEAMAWLGLDAYRFSIAWPRVIPDGAGQVNGAGLDFYDRLVDCLLERGIEPFATLYHWDLPQALEDAGGWPAREVPLAFERYASAVGARLGDRVRHWMTLNEPAVVSRYGYTEGTHAPGRREAPGVVSQVEHHLLLAHGLALRALREVCPLDAKVGIVLNPDGVWPATDSPQDRQAANRAWVHLNGWWSYPLFRGHYPEEELRARGPDAPRVEAGNMDAISAPIDFLGINIYFRRLYRADDGSPRGFAEVEPPAETPRTAMGWEVWPPVLFDALRRMDQHHPGTALYITENGAAFDDEVSADGQVHDERRVRYLRDHIAQAHRALREGIDLRGYFVWSLLDNFEWALGLSRRFGIIRVDYGTLERTPKDSARFYRGVIRRNGLPAGG